MSVANRSGAAHALMFPPLSLSEATCLATMLGHFAFPYCVGSGEHVVIVPRHDEPDWRMGPGAVVARDAVRDYECLDDWRHSAADNVIHLDY